MTIIFNLLGFAIITLLLLGPLLILQVGKIVGHRLRKKNAARRAKILQILENEEKVWESVGKKRRDSDEWESVERYTTETFPVKAIQSAEWDGIVGFFHPFCNAGGGGERVLWAAIQAIQSRWPKAKCVVYTGDLDLNKEATLAHVQKCFNINLHQPSIYFLYLTKRSWVLASSWPHFTLLGQSVGSLVLAWEAFSLLIPDIFIDTMGYAFSLAFCKLLFRNLPTGAYVHYPTISTDMISSLNSNPLSTIKGVNGGKGVGFVGFGKKIYWNLFAKFYSIVGGSIDAVMTNSSWTQDHIVSLWGPWRSRFKKAAPIIVYPPVAVRELASEFELSTAKERKRHPVILYLGQFRPEKNHPLILRSFSKFKNTCTPTSVTAKLILVGSVRDDDDKDRVRKLRLLAQKLEIKDSVVFKLDATWSEVLEWLGRASIGVNGMWNEHFGIGIVEYQAAGLIPVVHNSGGPKRDIVKTLDGLPTGFHANTAAEYAECFEAILSMSDREKVDMRQRARKNTERFTEEIFVTGWIKQMEVLVAMQCPF
ncbi:GDP-Man:Man-PP-Dol alpha-1,2-mannosyltransferase [Golovinomyces cichoracearum]|uniref:GDP-Man:Man(3)GlcNAc(2)-PP-Dol alpha-1,2-mannosyltransferase n=1 Tax=Golovinomyces cichoracearum TaxID=62708 RepID=A0A420J6N1_9PEZI|nr:GDP-Man:Man-PP-Dol alpha-1,2-mannosyltransferase [Golovinomyces cichoracearum]